MKNNTSLIQVSLWAVVFAVMACSKPANNDGDSCTLHADCDGLCVEGRCTSVDPSENGGAESSDGFEAGESCEANAECASRVCGLVSGDGICLTASRDCDPDCDADETCVEDQNGDLDCVRTIEQRGSASLRLEPTSLTFPRTEIGVLSAQAVTVRNVGSARVQFSDYQIEGSETFSIYVDDPEAEGDPCQLSAEAALERDPRMSRFLRLDPDSDAELGLNENATFTLCVTFQSESEVAEDGQLLIQTNAQSEPYAVSLRGNVAFPCVSVAPNPLSFGAGRLTARKSRSMNLESCGVLPVFIESIELLDDGEGSFSLVESSLPSRFPFTLDGIEVDMPSPENHELIVNFTPTARQEYRGTVKVSSNDLAQPEQMIELYGYGSDNECPVARLADTSRELRVAPLDIVQLDASASSDFDGPNRKPVGYRWTVVSRPNGSRATPMERFEQPTQPQLGGIIDDEDTSSAQFWVDGIGTYEIELTVIDDDGFEAPSADCPQESTRIRIESVSMDDLMVELFWDTPADEDQSDGVGTNMDLHLAHPMGVDWFDLQRDCFARNPRPQWPPMARSGDENTSGVGSTGNNSALLVVEDSDGAGPEVIRLQDLEDTAAYNERPYRVAVHYFDDGGDGTDIDERFGVSTASVKVTLRGGETMEFSRDLSEWQLWEVASLHWSEADKRVQALDVALVEFSPDQTTDSTSEQTTGEPGAVSCGALTCDLATSVCCRDGFDASCVAGDSCGESIRPRRCDGPEDCAPSALCCATVDGNLGIALGSSCVQATTCPTREFALCHVDSDCRNSQTCLTCGGGNTFCLWGELLILNMAMWGCRTSSEVMQTSSVVPSTARL